MPTQGRRALGLALVAALLAVGYAYRESFASMIEKWGNDSTFSHGYLIFPIVLWLVWEKRSELAAVEWIPSWLGAAGTIAMVIVWSVARGTGVLVVEQLAAVAIVLAIVMTVIGWRAAWALAFPLSFMFLSVPFGRALIPWLMQITADVATWALKSSGVPIHRSHMYISIPTGTFEVAKACGGLNYVIAGFVLGVLYGYLTYAGWRKRVVCALAFLIVPIMANGLRVYATIGVSHLTNMRFGPGPEHVTFGRLFFIAVMILMFWVGRRWRDDSQHRPSVPTAVAVRRLRAVELVPIPFALCVALMAPQYLMSRKGAFDPHPDNLRDTVAMPLGAGGWTAEAATNSWRPHYVGARVERSATYRYAGGERVDVYVGIYGIGRESAGEMISDENRVFASDDVSLAPQAIRIVELGNGIAIKVREHTFSEEGTGQLVWSWFMVSGNRTINPFVVKALEARAFITRSTDSARALTLATPLDDGASARLDDFVEAHSACVAAGFESTACP
jgi:exosortase A